MFVRRVALHGFVAAALLVSPAFAGNLLENPTFTGGITPWGPYGTTPTAATDDANGSLYSGSLQVVMAGDIPVGAAQCVNLGSEQTLELSTSIRRIGVTPFSYASFGVSWYDAVDCGGSFLSPSDFDALEPSETWTRVTPLTVPVRSGAASALVFFGAYTSGNTITVQYDDGYFGVPVVFEDGFETADPTRWSTVVP
jgi:hypothetical protein